MKFLKWIDITLHLRLKQYQFIKIQDAQSDDSAMFFWKLDHADSEKKKSFNLTQIE